MVESAPQEKWALNRAKKGKAEMGGRGLRAGGTGQAAAWRQEGAQPMRQNSRGTI